jgi:hypothetical protein
MRAIYTAPSLEAAEVEFKKFEADFGNHSARGMTWADRAGRCADAAVCGVGVSITL